LAGQDPLGQHVHVADPTSPPRTVVGIVGDIHHYALMLCLPRSSTCRLRRPTTSDLVFAVRSAGDPLQIANAVRLAIRSVDETLPFYRVVPMNEYVAATMANRRLALVLLGSFAGIALILSVVRNLRRYGIYGGATHSRNRNSHGVGRSESSGAAA